MKPTLTLPRPRVAKSSDDSIVAGELASTPGLPAEPALPSSRLLQGRKSVQIEHNGALYQLRATKFGKLILTK
jgi:hemin uptake protein HemP